MHLHWQLVLGNALIPMRNFRNTALSNPRRCTVAAAMQQQVALAEREFFCNAV